MTNITLPIYLDYSSTTPVDPRVTVKMSECLQLEGNFGNPASRSHRFGWLAEEAIDIARNQIADLVNADPREIVFTSGATESNNLAIKGAISANEQGKRHIITLSTEHKAVLDTTAQLEQEACEVTYLHPQSNGLLDLQSLKDVIREDTCLVSVMHVNNEIGVVQDIQAIGELCRANDILFHVDAAQSTGKVEIDLTNIKADLMSFSAHKTYGPKGIGALYVRRKPRVRIHAQMHGGGHEKGMRAGTLATHQIVGMGEAFEIAKHEMKSEGERIAGLRDRLQKGLCTLDHTYVNGDLSQRVPNILNISFGNIDGESLLLALKDVAVSSGSACTSASVEPSHVLLALGVDRELAHSSIRFSLGRYTTREEIDYVVRVTVDAVTKLRTLSPIYSNNARLTP